LAETTAEAVTVLRQRQELVSQLETLSLISDSERAPTAAAVLADVTAHLNKAAWLTTFELKGRDLRLVGLSPDSSAVVRGLAEASFIGETQLRSSTSASGNTGKERFEITAQVKAAMK
jgi:Fimbrial assembly protein (PilN)